MQYISDHGAYQEVDSKLRWNQTCGCSGARQAQQAEEHKWSDNQVNFYLFYHSMTKKID